jgi:hypothetical protein
MAFIENEAKDNPHSSVLMIIMLNTTEEIAGWG